MKNNAEEGHFGESGVGYKRFNDLQEKMIKTALNWEDQAASEWMDKEIKDVFMLSCDRIVD